MRVNLVSCPPVYHRPLHVPWLSYSEPKLSPQPAAFPEVFLSSLTLCQWLRRGCKGATEEGDGVYDAKRENGGWPETIPVVVGGPCRVPNVCMCTCMCTKVSRDSGVCACPIMLKSSMPPTRELDSSDPADVSHLPHSPPEARGSRSPPS